MKGDGTAPREPGRGAGGRTQRTWFNFPWGVCQDLACYHPLPPSQRLPETLLTSSLRNIYLFILAELGLVLFLCKIFVHLFVLTALGPHCRAGPSPAAERGPLSSWCAGSSLWWHLSLQSVGFSDCGT